MYNWGVKADEVREHLRGIMAEFGPKLAKAVLDRRDYDYQHELAVRYDAAVALLQRFEQEVAEHPGVDALVLLKGLESKLQVERAEAPEQRKGPSVWDLLQRPAL